MNEQLDKKKNTYRTNDQTSCLIYWLIFLTWFKEDLKHLTSTEKLIFHCANYKHISLMNSLARNYGKIIKCHVENEFADVKQQNGFGWVDLALIMFFCLRQIIEKEFAQSMEIHLIFIEVEVDYDSVPLCMLWRALKQCGFKYQRHNALLSRYCE